MWWFKKKKPVRSLLGRREVQISLCTFELDKFCILSDASSIQIFTGVNISHSIQTIGLDDVTYPMEFAMLFDEDAQGFPKFAWPDSLVHATY